MPGGPAVGAGQQPSLRLGNHRRCRRGWRWFRTYGSVSKSLWDFLWRSFTSVTLVLPPFYFHCFNRFKSKRGRSLTTSRSSSTENGDTHKEGFPQPPPQYAPHRMQTRPNLITANMSDHQWLSMLMVLCLPDHIFPLMQCHHHSQDYQCDQYTIMIEFLLSLRVWSLHFARNFHLFWLC